MFITNILSKKLTLFRLKLKFVKANFIAFKASLNWIKSRTCFFVLKSYSKQGPRKARLGWGLGHGGWSRLKNLLKNKVMGNFYLGEIWSWGQLPISWNIFPFRFIFLTVSSIPVSVGLSSHLINFYQIVIFPETF